MDHEHGAVDAEASTTRVIDLLPTGILLLGSEGLIAFANQRATQVFGEALVGRDVADVFAPLGALLEESARGRAQRVYVHPLTRQRVEIGYQLTPLNEELLQHILIFQDITETNRLRDERDRLLQIAAISDVLPSILHELKNPLAATRTMMELLVEEAPPGTLREELHAVLTEIRRMSLLLDGVGRIQQDLRSPQYQPIDQACREAFTVLEAKARSKGVRTRQAIASLPLLLFDAPAFRAIVYNLADNAIQACSSGDEVSLQVRLDGRVLELVVADTGPGMAPDVRSHARELFFTTKKRGTGIGLALCSSLAESAGGTLTIDSAPGAGTRITVRVPIEAPTEAIHVESRGPQSDSPPAAVRYP